MLLKPGLISTKQKVLRRRTFIVHGTIVTAGLHFSKLFSSNSNKVSPVNSLYSAFKDPENIYRPFVRWWWNGDKIEKDEITRELRLLKDAGIGGVEINPIKFPAKTDDLGKRSVPWLSDEWINLLQFALEEAKSLGMTCDLIVGSGWPFGGEWLAEEERSQIVVIATKMLEGPMSTKLHCLNYSKWLIHQFLLHSKRKMEMLSGCCFHQLSIAPKM